MNIIGITGAIGHGKSTLADAFLQAEPHSVHLESFYLISEVVDALLEDLKDVPEAQDLDAINHWLAKLPDILQKIVHVEPKPEPIILTNEVIAAKPVEYEKLFAQLDLFRAQPELIHQQVTDDNKPSYRPLLQWVGGYVTTHIDARAWYTELVRRAQKAGEEGKSLVIIGGLRFPNDGAIVHEAGGKVIRIIRPNAPQPDGADPTERERELIQVDTTVVNNGSAQDLVVCAQRLLTDLTKGQLAPEYKAI